MNAIPAISRLPAGHGREQQAAKARLRCAVYTRKSTEEGLEQEFNSLDAQYEACAAYVASQVGLGWKLVADRYDDGGVSGGTMERPALQRLLQDIRERRVDVVVVYKIDRLTRSLTDFARIVEVFDAAGASFVSVTQQFNTTTSMGRLTLNVLLSFAQFEREVTAERIRDKIAASRRKGMWMGGVVPLGYRVENRKLVIVEAEAATVRHLFARYLELKSVPRLAAELRREAAAAAQRLSTSAASSVGCDGCAEAFVRPMSAGALYRLLCNPVYVGRVRHHGRLHDGEHAGIVEPALFEKVQIALAGRAPVERGTAMHRDVHLLTGIVFDESGERLAPSHASNHGRRYRYYVSAMLLSKNGKPRGREDRQGTTGAGWRLPASQLEDAVLAIAADLLRDEARLSRWIEDHASLSMIKPGLTRAAELRMSLMEPRSPDERRVLLLRLIDRVVVASGTITIWSEPTRMVRTLLDRDHRMIPCDPATADNGPDVPGPDGNEASGSIVIQVPMSLKRRGNEARIVIDSQLLPARELDAALVELLARSHLYLQKLTERPGTTIVDVADVFGVHQADVSRILPLAFLSPEQSHRILTGQQPVELTARSFGRMDLPLLWNEQATVLDA